jgi:hypothetical protein
MGDAGVMRPSMGRRRRYIIDGSGVIWALFAQILMGLAEQAPRQQNHLNPLIETTCFDCVGSGRHLTPKHIVRPAPAVKRGRGRLIGLTKGRLNTSCMRLQIPTVAQSTCLSLQVR